MMDVYEAIRTRTSMREYKPDAVPQEVLERLLEALRLAPSGKNLQPWRFITVTDEDTRRELVDACRGQKFIAQAPVVLVGCGWESRAYSKMGGYWNGLPVDVAIAIEHLMLAAAAEGLGTCWIGAFDESAVKKVLAIPPDVKVIALTPIGYPATERKHRPRKELAEIIAHERW